MPTDSHSLSKISGRQRQVLLSFVGFCFSIVIAIGGYRSNPVFVTVFGVLGAIITLVVALEPVLAENPLMDIEIGLLDDRLSVQRTPVNSTVVQAIDSESDPDDRNTYVSSVQLRSPVNSTLVQRVSRRAIVCDPDITVFKNLESFDREYFIPPAGPLANQTQTPDIILDGWMDGSLSGMAPSSARTVLENLVRRQRMWDSVPVTKPTFDWDWTNRVLPNWSPEYFKMDPAVPNWGLVPPHHYTRIKHRVRVPACKCSACTDGERHVKSYSKLGPGHSYNWDKFRITYRDKQS